MGNPNRLVALNDAGVPLVETQGELTPFQRMVITREMERQQEEAQQEQQTGSAPQQNSFPGAGQSVDGDTTTYVNESVN